MATYSVSISEAASASDSITARLISDAQYVEWLKADNRQRCVLAELGVYTGGAETTRYISSLGYTSAPGESPANTAYEDILVGIPEIRSAMAEAFRGRSLISYGEIEIDNSGGVRDAWLLDAWDQRDVRLFLGDPSWQRSDFRMVFLGTIEDIRARDGRTLALRIRDRQSLLDVPLQTNLVQAGTAIGQKLPVCYGTCYNVEPKLTPAYGIDYYSFSDGSLQAINYVYEDGVDVGIYFPTWPGGRDGLGACGYKNTSNTGRITAHVAGFDTLTGDIVKKILINRAGLTEAQIDPAAITAYNGAGGGAAPVGYYTTDDSVTVAQALDVLMTGIGGYYTIDSEGRFTGGIFDRPSIANSSLSLTADDIEDDQIELVKRFVPPKSGRLGYKRYWGVLSAVSTSITDAATRARFTQQYEVTTRDYAAPSEFHGINGELEPSCFALYADASLETQRRKSLWGASLRFVFRFKAFLGAQQVKIGDCITIQLPRYGFDAGEKVIVVGTRKALTGGYVELEVFK